MLCVVRCNDRCVVNVCACVCMSAYVYTCMYAIMCLSVCVVCALCMCVSGGAFVCLCVFVCVYVDPFVYFCKYILLQPVCTCFVPSDTHVLVQSDCLEIAV